MLTNTPVWSYYNPGFIDPLYVPYHREAVPAGDGYCIPLNNWAHQGPPTTVNPDLVRINWDVSFQLLHPGDPCPDGWTKGLDGWCVRQPQPYEPVFYTDKAFIAKTQFPNGYTRPYRGTHRRISEQTDLRSVNPLTGQYQVSFQPVDRRNMTSTNYGRLPSKDSYLA